jgi:glycosyltransferase involved in cell wall biosynthesis
MNIYELLKKPTVSLIVVCYNQGKYLRECVLSIQNQTWENCEIILVDDGSNDTTREVMADISGVEKIFLDENLGQLGAFLEGLKRARGEFICMTDACDVLLPNFAQKHIEAHMRLSVAFTSCAQMEIDENSVLHCLNSTASPTFKNDGKTHEEEFKPIKRLPFGNWSWCPSSSAMMRRTALEPLLLYKNLADWKTGADKLAFTLLHLIGGSASVNTPLVAHREHGVSGNKKYLNPETLKRYIGYNKRIRGDVLKLILDNSEYFHEKFNPLNVRRMLWKIIFSFDLYAVKRAVKSLFV